MAACPACGKDNPDGFAFCGFCGASLAAVRSTQTVEERKVVSILFCDVVGFTAASERLDPEDVRARMQPYYSRLRQEIEAFGGTVEKFIGDAVMAVFGVPVAHEDDAERAVRSGLRILEAIADLNEAEPGRRLSVRIGVNTGEVVVALGATGEGEARVMGDAVNTAARIQTSAPVDGVSVGEGTFRATERVFEFEPLDPVAAKGKAEPVAVWQVLSARARFGSDVIRSMTTPLVGRETDVLLLRGTFDKTVREQSVQLVTVVGEPGVGKSRLVAELFAYIDGLPSLVTWRQGRCLPYGDGITFWALAEIVKAHAGIFESDTSEEAERKLGLVLPEGEDAPWMRARLLPLVGIDSGTAASREESFTAWRRFLEHVAETGPCVVVIEDLHWADDALLAFLEHLADWAQGVPLLVVCTARPELYETHSAWASGLANASAIRLSPLSNDETARLINALLDRAVLPADTQQLILERAGGNPLYAEEFVRMLRDRELLDSSGSLRADADLAFPDSIQALIAARLDSLSGERKALLQDAAVVGKVFWSGALAASGERPASDIEQALHELSRKELVRPSRQSSMQGEQEFAFWHILVRDVAYSQIPRAQRARKHLRAAAWLEEKADERVEDLAEVLAFHTGEALELARATGEDELVDEVLPRARRYALLAGERALGLDPAKALGLLERARDLTPADDPEYPRVLLRWGEALTQSGRDHDESIRRLREAVDAFRRRDDLESAASALVALGNALQYLGDAAAVRGAIEEAVALARTLPRGPVLVLALSWLAGVHWREADLAAAIFAADEALDVAIEIGAETFGVALGYRGLARCDQGDVEGLSDIEQGLVQLTAEGDGRSAANLRSNLGYTRWSLEGLLAALEAFEATEAFAARHGFIGVAQVAATSRLSALVEAGGLEAALADADRLLPALEASGNTWCVAETRIARSRVLAERGLEGGDVEATLADARTRTVDLLTLAVVPAASHRLATGRADEARELLVELAALPNVRDSIEYGSRLPSFIRSALAAGDVELAERLVEGVEPSLPIREHALVASAALLAEAQGEYADAASRFAEAAARWEGFGARLEQAYALLGEGRCLATLDDPSADGSLRVARVLFEDMGARPRVDECDALIAQVRALTS